MLFHGSLDSPPSNEKPVTKREKNNVLALNAISIEEIAELLITDLKPVFLAIRDF
jgi:hypothetical protein